MKKTLLLTMATGLMLSAVGFAQEGQTSTTETTKVKHKHKKHKDSSSTTTTTTTTSKPM